MKTNLQIYTYFLKNHIPNNLLFKGAFACYYYGKMLDFNTSQIVENYISEDTKNYRIQTLRDAIKQYNNDSSVDTTKKLFVFLGFNDNRQLIFSKYEKFFFKTKYNLSTTTIINTFFKHYNIKHLLCVKQSPFEKKYHSDLLSLWTRMSLFDYFSTIVKTKDKQEIPLNKAYLNYVKNIYANQNHLKISKKNLIEFID